MKSSSIYFSSLFSFRRASSCLGRLVLLWIDLLVNSSWWDFIQKQIMLAEVYFFFDFLYWKGKYGNVGRLTVWIHPLSLVWGFYTNECKTLLRITARCAIQNRVLQVFSQLNYNLFLRLFSTRKLELSLKQILSHNDSLMSLISKGGH